MMCLPRQWQCYVYVDITFFEGFEQGPARFQGVSLQTNLQIDACRLCNRTATLQTPTLWASVKYKLRATPISPLGRLTPTAPLAPPLAPTGPDPEQTPTRHQHPGKTSGSPTTLLPTHTSEPYSSLARPSVSRRPLEGGGERRRQKGERPRGWSGHGRGVGKWIGGNGTFGSECHW